MSLVVPNGKKQAQIVAFSYVNSLKKVTIGSGVEEVELYPFDNCDIEELIIENEFIRLGYAAFRGNAFKEVPIPATAAQLFKEKYSYKWERL